MNSSDLDFSADEQLPRDLKLAKDQNVQIQFADLSQSLQQRMHTWLIQTRSDLFNTDGKSIPNLKHYVFSVISIMAISAVLWGTVWKSGTLDAFLFKQHHALSDWVDQKTVNVEVLNLQFRGKKEKKNRLKAKLLQEAEEKKKNWSTIWERMMSLPQIGFSNLSGNMSWSVLWGSWAAFFMDPFGLIPSLVSQNTKFRMLCLMTLVKIVTYTFDLVRNKCDGIFDVNYRTFIPRITLAMLKSFTRMLERFVRKETIAAATTTTTENNTPLSEAKIQLRALKAANESLPNIAIDEFDKLIENPIQFGIKVQDTKIQIDMLTKQLWEFVDKELEPVIHLHVQPLRDIKTSDFAGKFNIPGNYFSFNRYSMLDSEPFYNIWISIVETMLKSNAIAQVTVQQVSAQAAVNDQNPQWVQGVPFITSSHWRKPKFGKILEQWMEQRDAMESLQKFVKMNILPESVFVLSAVENAISADANKESNVKVADSDEKTEETQNLKPADYVLEVPLELIQQADVLDHGGFSLHSIGNIGRFFVLPSHQAKFANQIKIIDSISNQCGQLNITCYDKVLKDTATLVQSFHNEIETAKDEYIRNIRAIYKRHKLIILLCQTMCRILQYFISNVDAFILTLNLYVENKEIPKNIYANADPTDIWNTKGAFKVLKDNLDNFRSLKTSKEFVSFQEAQYAIYIPCSSRGSLKPYVRRLSAIMCSIVHGVNQSNTNIDQIKRLFNIPDESKCDIIHACETCVCIGDTLKPSSKMNVKYSDIVRRQSEHPLQTLHDIG